MFRRVLLVLPLLTLASGCHSFARDVVAIEHQPGTKPATTVAKCDAAYTLYASDPQVARGTIDVTKGATIGFRREPDGSLVAVVGEQSVPIPDEPAAWRYAPKPFWRWNRFTGAVAEGAITAVSVVAVPLFPLVILWQMMTGGELP